LLGVVVGGAGVAALAVGGVIGLVAKSHYNSAEGESTGRHADSVAAVNTGNIATAVAIGGGVLAATGVVLWLTAPHSVTKVGSNGRELFVGGEF
jgi:hypothetical protein